MTAAEVSTAAPAAVFHHSCRAMGTRFSMVLSGVDAGLGESLAEFAESFLRSQERLMSRFDAHSPVSELNGSSAGEIFTPPPALWKILLQCRDHCQRTRGAFDIAQLPLNQLWREHLERGEMPSDDAISEVRTRTGMERIRFDTGARTIQFLADGMAIDLGGFGKGWALEQLAVYFRERGVARAFFSFGESSVTVIGSHPHGPAWPVGIANMFHPETAVHTFSLRDASLSTSGTAPFNNAAVADRRYSGTINPRDGRPIEGYRTMSVASANAVEAEVLSTALLVTPEAERAEILKCYPGASAVEIVYELCGDNSVVGQASSLPDAAGKMPAPLTQKEIVAAFVPRVQWRHE